MKNITADLHWGSHIRPLHFSLRHLNHLELFASGHFCSCSGLDLGSSSWDGVSGIMFRTPSELECFCNHLLTLALLPYRPARLEARHLNVPGFSPEFAEESCQNYDATALKVQCWRTPHSEILLGCKMEPDAIVLSDGDVALAFQATLREFAEAWAAKKINVRKANPFSLASTHTPKSSL
jgi:hypothetical protein